MVWVDVFQAGVLLVGLLAVVIQVMVFTSTHTNSKSRSYIWELGSRILKEIKKWRRHQSCNLFHSYSYFFPIYIELKSSHQI